MTRPRYRPGDHVRALRNIDGATVLAPAFVVTSDGEGRADRPDLTVEFLADGERQTYLGAGIDDCVLPD